MRLTLMTTSMVFPLVGKLHGGVPKNEVYKEYSEMLSMAAECGLEAVEITSLELDIFGLERVRTALNNAGLKCGCVIHMDTFAETDETRNADIVSKANQKILDAKELGANYVMLALMAQEGAEAHSMEELTSALIRNIRPVAEFGKEHAITISVEDTPDIRLPLSSSVDIRPILNAIPELALTYDTGNMLFRGEDTVHFYNELKDRVAYVHIKDMQYTTDPDGADITEDGRYLKCVQHGEGIIDFREVITALSENGYDGWLMLEYAGTEDHQANIIAAKKYIGKYLRNTPKMDLGCNLFGLAMDMEQDTEGTIRKLAEAGFTSIETLFSFPDDPALLPGSPVPGFVKAVLWNEDRVTALLPLLNELGICISSMHVGFAFGKEIEEGCRELIDFAGRTGIKHFITSLEFDSPEKMENAASLMNKAADLLSGTGVTLSYHNHSMEFEPLGDGSGRTLMDAFLEKTSPNVKLQLDVGWVMYAGADVVPFIRKYADRIISIHLKDFVEGFDQIPLEEAFAFIGNGVLPTEEILELLPKLDLMENGLIIDQDRAAKGTSLQEDLRRGSFRIMQNA